MNAALHLSLTGDAVAHQWLVYAKDGHFSEITGIHTLGGVTVYRLPFWNYTTPLVAKAGRELDARRWLLLGTFLFAPPRRPPCFRGREPHQRPLPASCPRARPVLLW